MKYTTVMFVILVCMCTSCQTYVASNGKKHIQLFPAKDRNTGIVFDTGRFAKQAFDPDDYVNKIGYIRGKKMIEPMEGADLLKLAKLQRRYYVYFFDPVCPGSAAPVRKLDSLAKTGENVVIVSLRNNYEAIHATLRKTAFSQYPYYTIENKKYPTVLLQRQIKFIKDACEECYSEYKDEVAGADYMLIENGTIRPLFYNDNIIKNLR